MRRSERGSLEAALGYGERRGLRLSVAVRVNSCASGQFGSFYEAQQGTDTIFEKAWEVCCV